MDLTPAHAVLPLAILGGVAYYPFLRGSRTIRLTGLALLIPAVLSLPALVPDGEYAALARALLGIGCLVVMCKMIDLHVGYPKSGRPPFKGFALFLLSPLNLVFRRIDAEKDPGRRANALRLGRGLLEGAIGVAAYRAVDQADLGQTSLLLDHCARWLAIYPALDGGVIATVAVLRLLGWRAQDVYREPILARTPADFWRRYNRPVGQWLFENVFRPVGGLRAPVRATLLAFFVSGLVHEYILLVAVKGRTLGYQMTFFMLHGVAVLLTQKLQPRGWKAVASTGATAVFTLASLIIFMTSFNEAVKDLLDFYPHGSVLPIFW